jgi:Xaa-Pro aminopeptidase
MKRVEALRQLAFADKQFDAFLVLNETNQLYFAGMPGTSCLLIPKKGEGTLFVYALNYENAKAEAKGFDVEKVERGQNFVAKLAARLKPLKAKKIAFDAVSHEAYRMLAKEFRGKARLTAQNGLVQQLRRVKDADELKLMRKAGKITVAGMKAACETVKPGTTEIEVAGELEYAMRNESGWGLAFESIVASGVRSAYPHGGCTERKISKGDLVVVDIGAVYRDYRSDMTRTFVAGKPSKKQTEIFDVVKDAQKKACGAMKEGKMGKAIDLVARKSIDEAGYADLFNHGLGHGVGLEVHEGPVLAPNSKDRLVKGNVVTVEPGIYVAGFGGVRIEDTVLVDKQKCEKFTDGFYSLETVS